MYRLGDAGNWILAEIISIDCICREEEEL